MIVKLVGKLVGKTDHSLMLDVHGVHYEIWVANSILSRAEDQINERGELELMIYHYFQIGPSSGMPVLVGFLNEVERDFFLAFITVSGIGPRAAVKALNCPISEISRAIDEGDIKFLKTLPGIGTQKAKEIIAKLQGKVAKFGLIRDGETEKMKPQSTPDWQKEALDVLLQLQYKKPEAAQMIAQALQRTPEIHSAESLLNEIYKQRMNRVLT